MKMIADLIGIEALLGQAAEEAVELAKVLLKLQRIMEGHNPTPVTEGEAREMIMEESADLANCLHELDKAGVYTVDINMQRRKMDRWYQRIEEAKSNGKI